MDISIIDHQKVNFSTGIKLGNSTAPHQMAEFINLRCPYCKAWFEKNDHLLQKAVGEGKLYRVIKLFDKEKESLQRGNVMHRYVSKTDSALALEQIREIFATQEEWQDQSIEEVAWYAEEKLSLTEEPDVATTANIIEEAATANIQFVPTIVLDQHIFDESISENLLMTYLV